MECCCRKKIEERRWKIYEGIQRWKIERKDKREESSWKKIEDDGIYKIEDKRQKMEYIEDRE